MSLKDYSGTLINKKKLLATIFRITSGRGNQILERFIKSNIAMKKVSNKVVEKRASIKLFLTAVKDGNIDAVRSMLDTAGDQSSRDCLILATDEHKKTALHLSAKHGKLAVVDYLLKQGVDINAKDKNDEGLDHLTPLHYAAKNGHKEVVEILLENHAHVDAEDKDHLTPLYWAIQNGHKAIVEMLLEKQVNIDATTKNNMTPLHVAAQNGHMEIVTALLKQGADIDAKDQDNLTPLHLAVENGHKKVIEILLKKQADVDAEDKDHWTPLHWAAQNGHEEVIGILLKQNANISAVDMDNLTPLHVAAKNGHKGVIQTLLKKQANIDAVDKGKRTPLHMAAFHGYKEAVEALLEKQADVDAKDEQKRTPLHWAAKNGHKEVIQTLLKKQVNIDVVDQWKRTPLHWAAKNGHKEVVTVLLEQGADVDAEDKEKKAPLHCAAKNGHKEVVTVLLEQGADVDIEDKEKKTPLHCAAKNGHKEVVTVLLEQGADVDAEDKEKKTPLHWATENGHKEVVTVLLEQGADVDAEDKEKKRPLHCAAENGHKEVVTVLLEQVADVDIEDKEKKTPLHWAAKNGHKEVVTVLLEQGADVDAEDKEKKTPLHWAAKNGHKEVVTVLLEQGADVDAEDKEKKTPLHWVAENGHKEVVTALLEQEADVLASNNHDTVLHRAVNGNNIGLIILMLDKIKESVDQNAMQMNDYNDYLNAQDNEGDTPLMWAIKQGKVHTAKILLEYGVNINAQNNEGMTALHWSAKNSHLETLQLLIGNKANANIKDHNNKTPLDLAQEKSSDGTIDQEEKLAIITALLAPVKNESSHSGSLPQQIQSQSKQQKAYIELDKYIVNHFPKVQIEAVKQGLYLPAFEVRKVKMDGKCGAITRLLSQSLWFTVTDLSATDTVEATSSTHQLFLNNLQLSASIYERLASGQQISSREEAETFAFSNLVHEMEQQLIDPTSSLPLNLIHLKNYKPLNHLSDYVSSLKGDFAIHLVTNNHVVAIYRVGDQYIYFDSNVALVSSLKNVSQLMNVVQQGVELAGYALPKEGFLVEHFDVHAANRQLTNTQQQVLTSKIITERELLARQDEDFGLLELKIDDVRTYDRNNQAFIPGKKHISRTSLYDLGAKLEMDGATILIHSGMGKMALEQHLKAGRIKLTARAYLQLLHSNSNAEAIREMVEATTNLPLLGSNREIKHAQSARNLILAQDNKEFTTRLPEVNYHAHQVSINVFNNLIQSMSAMHDTTYVSQPSIATFPLKPYLLIVDTLFQ